jgi:3-hydroxybutyryl-CoA dehydrogenase
VASPADIDTALKLGVNYPRGPLEWGDEAGVQWVCELLESMRDTHAGERYNPSLALYRRAASGQRLL